MPSYSYLSQKVNEAAGRLGADKFASRGGLNFGNRAIANINREQYQQETLFVDPDKVEYFVQAVKEHASPTQFELGVAGSAFGQSSVDGDT